MFRMFRSLAVLAALAVLSGCGRATTGDTASGSAAAPRAVESRMPPVTEGDRQATAALRRSILADPSMSVDARNIFITTQSGNMLLRGAVQDDSERAKIKETAGNLEGVTAIIDELQLPAPDPQSIAGSPTGQGGDNVHIQPESETGR